MPKKLERKLKAKARKKFPGNKKRQDAYVYGTLRKTGWTPSTQKKRKMHVPGGSMHEVVETSEGGEVYECVPGEAVTDTVDKMRVHVGQAPESGYGPGKPDGA